MKRLPIRDTGLTVSPICFGTSAIGNMPDTYGYGVNEDTARETLDAIFNSPVNFMDTSRNYGLGESEKRIGSVIKDRGGLPDDFVLATKLDRDNRTNVFDADRAWASLDESLNALHLEKIPLLHLHDPEYASDLNDVTKSGGALDALFKMKEEGLTQAVGLAMGRLDIMYPILKDWPFDALISHNRFTLLNRSASDMFDYAYENNIAILNAAPFAGGVLAKGSEVMPRITYQPADAEMLAPVKKIEELCSRHATPVGPAALQFSMNDQRVISTIVGVSKKERVEQTLDWANKTIPLALQEDLSKLPFAKDDPEAGRDYKLG